MMEKMKIKIWFRIPFTVYFLIWIKDLKLIAIGNKLYDGEYYWNVIGYEREMIESPINGHNKFSEMIKR